MYARLRGRGRAASITWSAKGHAGIPGNEKADDALAGGAAAARRARPLQVSLPGVAILSTYVHTYLKLKGYNSAKAAWNSAPENWGALGRFPRQPRRRAALTRHATRSQEWLLRSGLTTGGLFSFTGSAAAGTTSAGSVRIIGV